MCQTFTARMPPEGDALLCLRTTYSCRQDGYSLDLPVPGQLFGANKYLPCVHKSSLSLLQLVTMEVHKLLHLTVMHQTQPGSKTSLVLIYKRIY